MTHGSKSHRQHGSIGSSATPSRVLPGLKMAGQMGNKRKTLRNLQVRWLPLCRKVVASPSTYLHISLHLSS